VAAGQKVGNIVGGVRWVSYLPLAHIAERMFTLYIPVCAGGHVHFCPDAKQLVGVVGQVQPTAFFGVPRVWEKIQAGLQALLAAEADESRRAAVAAAIGQSSGEVITGKYDFTDGPVKNVATHPDYMAQWQTSKDSRFMYDLVIVNNAADSSVPVTAKLLPL